MRIASSQFQASMNRSLQINQTVIAKLTEQMATGNKIQVPSDEPIANVRLSRLRREENIVSQYVDNISAVKIRLSKNETYLSSMVDDMGARARPVRLGLGRLQHVCRLEFHGQQPGGTARLAVLQRQYQGPGR
ncbi:hypothetical protein [Massilia eburnea]|uniref:flagellin N-terminal helical domain-containing protein n=1 Tax=Massilia eburnea TaxID=1776165 RepID=UPI003D6C68A0